MAKFITSIKLQEATERDYAKLSQELKKYLFSPAGKSGSGKPTESTASVTYNSTDNKSLLDTTKAISRAAANTGRKFSFTVIREKIKTDIK
jgi:hypothetical protein